MTDYSTPIPGFLAKDGGRSTLCLLGAMTRNEVMSYVRSVCHDDEARRLPAVLDSWRGAAERFGRLVAEDPYRPSEIRSADNLNGSLTELRADPLFQSTFSQLPTTLGMVEIDHLIAPQRRIDLEFVSEKLKSFGTGLEVEDLVEICLTSKNPEGNVNTIQSAPNTGVFSDSNRNLRFLGGFLKPLDASDVAAAHLGGVPAAAVVLLVGYGSPCVNVIQYRDRVVLNNGFHRAYVLRVLGHRYMPAVVQHVENAQLEFPPQVVGLPKDYLLGHPRPVLMKDFFNQDLVIALQEKRRLRTVTLQWAHNEQDVPVGDQPVQNRHDLAESISRQQTGASKPVEPAVRNAET